LHVCPPDWKGAAQQPGFIGIMAAYLSGSVAADHYNVYEYRVRAGDTLLVPARLYKDDWHYYATSSVCRRRSTDRGQVLDRNSPNVHPRGPLGPCR
jgi:hypothetical protein